VLVDEVSQFDAFSERASGLNGSGTPNLTVFVAGTP
jgi:hypothetical protein